MAQIDYKAIGGLSSNQYQLMCMEIKFTTTDTYTAGGIAIPFKNFEPTMVVNVIAVDGTANYTPAFDLANKKLVLFASGSEVSAFASDVTFHLTFFGNIL